MNILPFFREGFNFVNDANFAFFVIYVHEKALFKLDYSFCIVLVCSELQQVFTYMEYLKSFFILSYFEVLF